MHIKYNIVMNEYNIININCNYVTIQYYYILLFTMIYVFYGINTLRD